MAHLNFPAPSPQQLPIRTLSAVDLAGLMYGHTALHEAWAAMLADRPMTWLQLDVVLQ